MSSDLLKITKRYNIHMTLISHLRKSSGEGKSFEEGIMPNLDSIKGVWMHQAELVLI